MAVRSGVTQWKVGDRVAGTFFQNWTGSPFHAGVAATALFGAGSIGPRQTVLVLATGGASLFTLQLAKVADARVVVTSSSDEELTRARALGARTIATSWKPATTASDLEPTPQHPNHKGKKPPLAPSPHRGAPSPPRSLLDGNPRSTLSGNQHQYPSKSQPSRAVLLVHVRDCASRRKNLPIWFAVRDRRYSQMLSVSAFPKPRTVIFVPVANPVLGDRVHRTILQV